MDYDNLLTFIQQQFRDGLVLVVGSGLSQAEGIPGMGEIAQHLTASAAELTGHDASLWANVARALAGKEGLEAALLKHVPSDSLETWIARRTAELMLPKEHAVMSAVVNGERTLRLTTFLNKILKPPAGLPILTPNYDRLIEVACEAAGFHVDTTAIGLYAGAFDHRRSCMASCRGRRTVGKTIVLDHYPRAVVLKPHGSLDWYRNDSGGMRCSLDLDADRLIITPGLNKYKAGYGAPFDKHRDLANDYIKQAARLLVVGYGFNDDHLQTHLVKRIQDGTPTLILARTASKRIEDIASDSPRCVSVSRAAEFPGISVLNKNVSFQHRGPELWDLGVLATEVLA
ncbi:MAG: SIR2 family protein [Anaerolineae bacterium]